MLQTGELHSQRVEPHRIETKGFNLQDGRTAEDHGEDDYNILGSFNDAHGLTTRYQSTMAVTDEMTSRKQIVSNIKHVDMKYHSAR